MTRTKSTAQNAPKPALSNEKKIYGKGHIPLPYPSPVGSGTALSTPRRSESKYNRTIFDDSVAQYVVYRHCAIGRH